MTESRHCLALPGIAWHCLAPPGISAGVCLRWLSKKWTLWLKLENVISAALAFVDVFSCCVAMCWLLSYPHIISGLGRPHVCKFSAEKNHTLSWNDNKKGFECVRGKRGLIARFANFSHEFSGIKLFDVLSLVWIKPHNANKTKPCACPRGDMLAQPQEKNLWFSYDCPTLSWPNIARGMNLVGTIEIVSNLTHQGK